MNLSKVRGVIAAGIIVLPVLIWVFLKLGTSQQFHSLPFVHVPQQTGDAAKCGLSGFSLTTAEGKPFTAADMAGSVWVVGFFNRADSVRYPVAKYFLGDAFTNADQIKTVRFLWVAQVSHPDSMQAWQALANSLSGKTDEKWVIATGSQEAVQQLATNLCLPEYRDSLGGKPILYPPVALVDKQGFSRGGNNFTSKKNEIPSGYYFSTKDFDMQKLKEDMRALMMIEYPQDMKK